MEHVDKGLTMRPSGASFIEAVPEYTARGWRVVPLQPPIQDDPGTGKRPLPGMRDWPTLRLSPEEVSRYWANGECPNLGILTGEASGVVVLDFDDPALGVAWLGIHPDAAQTYMVARDNAPPGRFHAYFQVPEGTTAPRSQKGEGWDLLSGGRQVCAPPSVHHSGGVYGVKQDAPLLDWNPAWLPVGAEMAPAAATADRQGATAKGDIPPSVAALILNGARQGERNYKAFQLACQLRDAELDAATAEAHVMTFAANCKPPLAQSEARAALRSAYSRQARPPARQQDDPRDQEVSTLTSWPDLDEGVTFEPLPPFPLNAMPPALGPMAVEISETIRVPMEAAALSVLTVAGVCVGRDVYVRVKRGVEGRGNLYSFIFMARGERKSSLFTPAMAPIQAWILGREQEYQRARRRLLRKERRLKALEEASASPKTKPGEAQRLEAEMEQILTEIEAERAGLRNPAFLVEDATPEAISDLMVETGGLVGVFTDDARTFLKLMLGLYSGGETREDIHIRAFDGSSPLRKKRSGRATETVERPCEGILLLVQTDYLRKLGESADLFDSGYMSRNIFCVPDSWVGRRDPDGHLKRAYSEREVDPTVCSEYTGLVERLLDNAWERAEPQYVGLSPDAKGIWVEFHDKVESQSGGGGALVKMLDFAARFPAQALRLALIAACCEGSEQIEEHHMRNSIVLTTYFAMHAQRAQQAMKSHQLPEGARRVLSRIRKDGLMDFSISEMQRALGLRSSEETEAAVAALASAGYCRPLAAPERESTPGRKPSPRFEVNPQVHNKE
jgi:hypothetical protein